MTPFTSRTLFAFIAFVHIKIKRQFFEGLSVDDVTESKRIDF